MKIIKGKVVEGKKRGRMMGFPTANLLLDEEIDEGIYLSFLYLDDEKYPSLTFIGAPITFNEKQIKAETFILNFDKDIYNKEITVELLKKIRDNRKFESQEMLVLEMENDKKIAEEYFKKCLVES